MRPRFRLPLSRVVLIAVGAFSLAACGGDGSTTGVTTDPNTPNTPNTPAAPSVDFLSFVRTRASGGKTIWQLGVVEANGANLKFLTDTLWEIFGADFSPDGTRIAFAARANTAVATADVIAARTFGLWLVNRDGTGLTRLTTTPAAYFPKWTPTGTQILFSQGGIWIINADGTGLRSITPETMGDINPVMSPDGGSIAFNRMTNSSGTEAQLYVMTTAGVGASPLAPPGAGYATPSWSADGRRVVYVQGNAVRAVNLDGTNTTNLSSMLPANVSSFALRTDEKGIAYTGYTTCCSGNASIYTVDLTTGTRTQVTPSGAYTDLWPSWALKR